MENFLRTFLNRVCAVSWEQCLEVGIPLSYDSKILARFKKASLIFVAYF